MLLYFHAQVRHALLLEAAALEIAVSTRVFMFRDKVFSRGNLLSVAHTIQAAPMPN